MVADSFQDLLKDPNGLIKIYRKREKKLIEEPEPELFVEYLKTVDLHLVKRGMAFKPAKSIEFGKTDQSMLNHIRNGILFLFRFNDALKQLDVRSLDEKGLRECIALFVVHELHKLESGEWMEDEEAIERPDSMVNAFDIPVAMVKRFVEEMHLRDFAPELEDEDYFSVAVALHKSRFSRSGARTSHFMDLEPFLYLMDNMASCASPEEAVSDRSLAALRDGFPQDSAEVQLNLQYHRLDDVKGILSGIINKSVAHVLQEQGLIMLMAYQDGCVYIGRGMQKARISEDFIEKVYEVLETKIKSSSAALSDPSRIGNNLKTPRLGYYGLSDEYYFFSGAERMLRTFIDKSIISAHAEKNTGLTDSMIDGIKRCSEVVPLEMESSKDGQKILLGFARAVATVHQSFISEIISDNRQSLQKTCEIWDVPAEVSSALLNSMEKDATYLASGGKWDYSYAIAQCVMNCLYDETKLRNMQPLSTIDLLNKKIWNRISQMDGWDEFVASKTNTYSKELVEYLHDVLTINGTISLLDKTNLSDTYKEYELSGKTCNLCNRGTLLNKKDMENSNSFLSFNFTNRVFVGKSKPTNIFTCVPCGVELALRMNGFNLPKGKGSNNEVLYFHFIPDYFFTSESWELVNSILSRFSDEARVRMAALAKMIFDSKYVGGSTEKEINVDVYNSWIKDLAAKEGDEGSKGMSMAQYMAQGYDNIIGNASMIFYKPSENTTEFHFFGVYIALIIAAYTGMRVVISHSPITTMRGRDFKEVVALDSINSHVIDFYGKFIPLSKLEETIKSASALIRLGYNTKSGLKDSLFPKYLRVMRDEILPGSYLLKMVYRGSENENKVQYLLDEALVLDKVKGDRR
ncbi:MAG: type I-D CRISPR-associated protein Cas10d/Csc3 [Methanothrix sp.]|nr:type I-D CRISPR-associated protein Cas10d/Csc3 [Methanothrix sp.]